MLCAAPDVRKRSAVCLSRSRLLRGDRSPELLNRLKLSSLGLVVVIGTIGFLMMTKPGRRA